MDCFKIYTMRKLIRNVILMLLFLSTLTACYTGRKNLSQLGGLMLLDNTQLSRNKAYYSKHNRKVKKHAPGNHKKIKRINYRARH